MIIEPNWTERKKGLWDYDFANKKHIKVYSPLGKYRRVQLVSPMYGFDIMHDHDQWNGLS